MYSLSKILFQITFLACVVRGQFDSCRTPIQEEGRCISLNKCNKLQPLVHLAPDDLRQYECGWEKMVPKVCCPSSTTATPATTRTTATVPNKLAYNTATDCVTPNNQPGSCVPWSSCSHIENMSSSERSLYILQYTQLPSDCHKSISICCEIETKSPVPGVPSTCPQSALPDSQCCQTHVSYMDKIKNGQESNIYQYPWMAYIEYLTAYRWGMCGGSLISNKYVLTAAHCFYDPYNYTRIDPTAVVLGDHNTTNSGVDCQNTPGGGRICTLGEQRLSIELTTIHPDYEKNTEIRSSNDIALIRLATMVTFTDFIKPICLPTSDITKTPQINLTFFAAGWGSVNENIVQVFPDVKQHTSLPFVDHQSCQSYYGTEIWQHQICAGGEETDTCRGDSGGPLMYELDDVPVLGGVTSFGTAPCGVHRWPAVYTKVYDYLPWIQEMMT